MLSKAPVGVTFMSELPAPKDDRGLKKINLITRNLPLAVATSSCTFRTRLSITNRPGRIAGLELLDHPLSKRLTLAIVWRLSLEFFKNRPRPWSHHENVMTW